MNATQIPFSIPNVTARKLIESFQRLQLTRAPATGAARILSFEVNCKQKDGREAVAVTIKLSYLGDDPFNYIYEGHFVNDAAVVQYGSYVGDERNFRCGDSGLFTEAVITGTV